MGSENSGSGICPDAKVWGKFMFEETNISSTTDEKNLITNSKSKF